MSRVARLIVTACAVTSAAIPCRAFAQAAPDALAREVRLETVLEIAERTNPEIREAQERVRSADARALAAGRLPDLEAKYEQWGVPLARPYALNEAATLMFGVRQAIPAPGVLGARSRAAEGDAQMLAEAERARRQDIRLRVKRAFYEYYRAEREYRIHLEHVALETRIVELARQNYQVGRATQQDVLRTVVDLSRLHNDVVDLVQQLESSKARLNTLMARPIDAALGPPSEVTADVRQFEPVQIDATVDERRPEVVAAKIGIQRSEAALDAARTEATVPSLMVGADYWFQPTSSVEHAYGAMVSINLPWLSGRRRDEVRNAEHTLAADIRSFESTRNSARFEARDALARLSAARQSFRIIDQQVLPQARQSLEAAQAAFSAGKGDALGLLDAARSYLQVRIEQVRAVARLGSSLGELERAVGAALEDAAPAAQGNRK